MHTTFLKKNRIRGLFNNEKIEILIVFLIILSILAAIFSIFVNYTWLEKLNYGFSFFFCFELMLRFTVRSNTRSYFKTYWLDWIASIPWDLLLLLTLPKLAASFFWVRIFRIPRVIRILRIVSLQKSNALVRINYQIKKQLERNLINQMLILTFISIAFVVVFTFFFHADANTVLVL